MEFKDLDCGAFIVTLQSHYDARGSLVEMYNKQLREKCGLLVQSNLLKSGPDILRGMHVQKNVEDQQAKYVVCIEGAVRDVFIDLRRDSKTYLKSYSVDLNPLSSKTNLPNSVYVPAGFCHGILTLGEGSLVMYMASPDYVQGEELCLHWSDPSVNSLWGVNNPVISIKDSMGLPLDQLLLKMETT